MRHLLCILVAVLAVLACPGQAPPDTATQGKNWKEELKHLRININDTVTRYPKFVRMAYGTARWVVKALYTYDTAYVEGFGSKWRFMVKCNNWFDTYTGRLTQYHMPIGMSSNITTKFGAHISYKGIGLGYMLNLKDVFTAGWTAQSTHRVSPSSGTMPRTAATSTSTDSATTARTAGDPTSSVA